MNLHPYHPKDLPALLTLFHDAVHMVCARDYTPAQLEAWAPAQPDSAAWAAFLQTGTTLVAEEDGAILGFGTIHPNGYLDLL